LLLALPGRALLVEMHNDCIVRGTLDEADEHMK
jgi:small nuclear ribonucleoprotein (snRNP)-like protein